MKSIGIIPSIFSIQKIIHLFVRASLRSLTESHGDVITIPRCTGWNKTIISAIERYDSSLEMQAMYDWSPYITCIFFHSTIYSMVAGNEFARPWLVSCSANRPDNNNVLIQHGLKGSHCCLKFVQSVQTHWNFVTCDFGCILWAYLLLNFWDLSTFGQICEQRWAQTEPLCEYQKPW